MRLFLAINLPDDLRHELWTAAAALRDAAPAISWVREPLIHLTLKFLGEQPEASCSALTPTLERIASTHSRPVVRLDGVGAFPNLRRPRVVWAGVDADPRLELLHHDVETGFAELGFELEGRAFRPHITLGRVRNDAGRGAAPALSRVARKVHVEGEFTPGSIDLMESTITPAGRSYRPLFRAALGNSLPGNQTMRGTT